MLRNLTPHAIHIYGESDALLLDMPVDPQGPARVSVDDVPVGLHGGIPLTRPRFGKATNLPDPADGVLLIVSLLVQQACPNRHDLVSPGDPVRDGQGRVIGARSLRLQPAS